MSDTTIPTALSQSQLDAIGREYQKVKLAKVAAEARLKELDEQLRSLDFGSFVAGPMKVTVAHNVARDAALFASTYPFEQYPELYKPTPDPDSIKDNLTGSQIRAMQKEGAARIVVVPFDE